MELIDAFNICLEAAGLRNISDINLDDSQTAQIDTIINREKRKTQYDGLPWNTDKVNLTVNIDGVIDVSGFLRVELPSGLVVLDDQVWDPANSVFWSEDISDVWVISDRDWSNIPELFQEWVARRSASYFVGAISGPDETFQEAKLREAEAFSAAHLSDDAEWNPNVLRDRRVRQYGGVGGGDYGFGYGYGRGC